MPTNPPQSQTRPKVRLYVEHALAEGQHVAMSQQHAHYLGNVMRMRAGDAVALFDGRSGEWRARISQLAKRGATLVCEAQSAPQQDPPDLWLLFAPIKKTRTDFIVEKAVELGVSRIQPVQTRFTNSERIRRDRLQAHAIEAAEQSGGTFVPPVGELSPLTRMWEGWPPERLLWWADESLAGRATMEAAIEAATESAAEPATEPAPAPAAILIGPEGGFSPQERAQIAGLPFVRRLSLGPRILRADTAAVAAMTLWQARHGDWR